MIASSSKLKSVSESESSFNAPSKPVKKKTPLFKIPWAHLAFVLLGKTVYSHSASLHSGV